MLEQFLRQNVPTNLDQTAVQQFWIKLWNNFWLKLPACILRVYSRNSLRHFFFNNFPFFPGTLYLVHFDRWDLACTVFSLVLCTWYILTAGTSLVPVPVRCTTLLMGSVQFLAAAAAAAYTAMLLRVLLVLRLPLLLLFARGVVVKKMTTDHGTW